MTSYKKVRPKYRDQVNKTESTKDMVDEWEIADIDRDEQKRGLKRREIRIKKARLLNEQLKKELEQATKPKDPNRPSNVRPPNAVEMAWLKCDFILSKIMEEKAYEFFDKLRTQDPECYKYLYRIFMSPYMMERADYYINYIDSGMPIEQKIPLKEVIKHYRKYKGISSNIRVIHKGEEEKIL